MTDPLTEAELSEVERLHATNRFGVSSLPHTGPMVMRAVAELRHLRQENADYRAMLRLLAEERGE